ncbi:MAG: DUF4124 domain-containing protein [Rhodanobacteraceae bacterium]
MRAVIATLLIVACIGWCACARAQVFKCTAPNGAVAFQDHACAASQRQEFIDVPSHAPPGYVPPPVATAPPPEMATPPSVAPPLPPPTPLPMMYACVGAVNGKHYLTRSPPAPYLAPLGMLGYPPLSLVQAYGSPGGAKVPVGRGPQGPSGNAPPATGIVGSGMMEVQDYCLPATRAEVCRFVQKEHDENQHKLNLAVPREQSPLEQRAQQLSAQLRNC